MRTEKGTLRELIEIDKSNNHAFLDNRTYLEDKVLKGVHMVVLIVELWWQIGTSWR